MSMALTDAIRTLPPEKSHPDPDSFAATLTRERERAGLSQAALGRRIGSTHSYISRIESGERVPSRTTMLALLHALDLAPDIRNAILMRHGHAPDIPASAIARAAAYIAGLADGEGRR